MSESSCQSLQLITLFVCERIELNEHFKQIRLKPLLYTLQLASSRRIFKMPTFRQKCEFSPKPRVYIPTA